MIDRPDPTLTSSQHPYLRALRERVLVYDGAMGTNIQRHNPTPDDFGGKALEGCNDNLVLTRPDIYAAHDEAKKGLRQPYKTEKVLSEPPALAGG